MGIKIAEPIQTLEYLRDSGAFPFNSKEGVLYTAESIDVAIETMRKYQKIEEIVHMWSDIELGADAENHMGLIQEIVEDGKVNN